MSGEDAAPQEDRPLRNDDFRKLLMTPRPGAGVATSAVLGGGGRARRDGSGGGGGGGGGGSRKHGSDDYYERTKKNRSDKKKKKHGGAQAPKYRDRAAERRAAEGEEGAGEGEAAPGEGNMFLPSAAAAGQAPAAASIEESKFLGGDVEHTHLVKGLDVVLLRKAREQMERQAQQELAEADPEKAGLYNIVQTETTAADRAQTSAAIAAAARGDNAAPTSFETVLGKNIFKAVFRRPPPPSKNELFLPRRMAYGMVLDDHPGYMDGHPDNAIPTINIRSKAECPVARAKPTQSTHEIVTNYLRKIIVDHRQGLRAKKKKSKSSTSGGGGSKGSAERSSPPAKPDAPAPMVEEDDFE